MIVLLIWVSVMICPSHGSLRPSRTRRRNNTGFYYGIRDDHMNFSQGDASRNYRSHVRWREARGRRDVSPMLSSGHGLFSTRYDSPVRENKMNQIQPYLSHEQQAAATPTMMQSVLSRLAHQQFVNQLISHNRENNLLNRLTWMPRDTYQNNNQVVQTAVKTKSKHQTSRKKRRKNNTGFYYGIREDVLILPGMNSAAPGGKRSHKLDGKKLQARQMVTDSHSPNLNLDAADGLPSSDKLNSAPLQDPHVENVIPQKPTRDESKKEKKQSALLQPQPSLEKGKSKMKQKNKKRPKNNNSSNQPQTGVYDETLQELREMKDEIIALRKELQSLKGQLHETNPAQPEEEKIDSEKSKWWARPSLKEPLLETPDIVSELDDAMTAPLPLEHMDGDVVEEKESGPKISPQLRRREFEQIGRNVESWACRLLFDQEAKEEDGEWKQIECSKFCRKKFNPDGRTKVYLKWMPDSRHDDGATTGVESTQSNESGQQQDFPCIKCYSTIDAPMDKVCSFLSNENTIPVYNELVEDYCDIEEITPHSKITWCKMPKVMFVKSRDFVTYCSHRWWRDGTQVIVNQACEHEDKPGVLTEGEGEACRGYALRGANFISKDPDDPNKTRITLLAHANPGGGLPQWAMTTAVNAVVQIEPFKLFHNINEGVSNYNEPPSSMSHTHQLATINSLPGRSNKPAGMAQMGYVCFWPNGGGLKDKHVSHQAEQEEYYALDD